MGPVLVGNEETSALGGWRSERVSYNRHNLHRQFVEPF